MADSAEHAARERVRRAFEVRQRSPEAPARPIAFNAAMVRALLADEKTQTRRPIRPLPIGETLLDDRPWPADATGHPMQCRLARLGDDLWVREPWGFRPDGTGRDFEADLSPDAAGRRAWRGGRFLPRDASRIQLRVNALYPERLQLIGDEDARAEGMPPGLFDGSPRLWFERLWDSIYGGGEFAWREDPWVWVIGFEVTDKPS
ncbi:MAG: hypothetical protein AAF561_09510 [Planctomycetota bacterium]